MSKILKQKWVWLTLITLFLCSGAYLIYSWSSQSSLTQHQLQTHQQRYQDLQDSIQVLNYNLRQDPEANIAQIQKDRIALFQTQINDLRIKISKLSSQQRNVSNSKAESGSKLIQWNHPYVRIGIWTTSGLLILIIALAVIIKRRRLNSHKIRIPQQMNAPSHVNDYGLPHEANPSAQASSELEALLNQLQANQPIAQPRERVKPSSVLVQSPHDMPEVQEEILENNPQSETETKTKTEGTPLKSKIQPSQVHNPAPTAEEIFPSTLNRFDQEDKDKSDVLKLARRGYTSSEIARRLKISQDQVDFIIKLQREKG